MRRGQGRRSDVRGKRASAAVAILLDVPTPAPDPTACARAIRSVATTAPTTSSRTNHRRQNRCLWREGTPGGGCPHPHRRARVQRWLVLRGRPVRGIARRRRHVVGSCEGVFAHCGFTRRRRLVLPFPLPLSRLRAPPCSLAHFTPHAVSSLSPCQLLPPACALPATALGEVSCCLLAFLLLPSPLLSSLRLHFVLLPCPRRVRVSCSVGAARPPSSGSLRCCLLFRGGSGGRGWRGALEKRRACCCCFRVCFR